MRTARSRAALIAFAVAIAAPRVGRAVVIERVVAVVGDRPILLSELRHRTHTDDKRLLRSTLDLLVDEALIDQQAEIARVSVSPDEVTAAIAKKTAQLGITEGELWAQVATRGFSTTECRADVARQLREAKVLDLQLARGNFVEPRLDVHPIIARDNVSQTLVLKVPRDAPDVASALALAREVIARARRRDVDWCDVVALFDGACGKNTDALTTLPHATELLASMKSGDISDPYIIDRRTVIAFRAVPRESAPFNFVDLDDSVRLPVLDRMTDSMAERVRSNWLEELHRSIRIDVRL